MDDEKFGHLVAHKLPPRFFACVAVELVPLQHNDEKRICGHTQIPRSAAKIMTVKWIRAVWTWFVINQ